MAYRLGDVVLDVIVSEDFNSSTPATSHALEDNSEMSDHITKEPKTLSLTCIVKDADNSKFNLLQKYQSEGRIIDYNNLTTLEHVVIESISVPRTADIKDGYELTIDFKQIKVSRKKIIPLTSGLVAKATANKKNMGLHIPQEVRA